MEAFEISGEINKEGKLITREILPVHSKKIRILLMIEEEKEEREQWLRTSAKRLEQAFEGDETEYSLDMVKEPNSKYNRGEKR